MRKETDYKKIAKYLVGECTDEEIAEIQNRIEKDREYARVVREFEKIWKTRTMKAKNWDIDGVWKRLNKEIEAHKSLSDRRESGDNKSDRLRQVFTRHPAWGHWTVRIAAVFVLIVLSLLFAILYLSDFSADSKQAMQEVVTQKGQRATIQLDDGSRIRLNSESTLQYPDVFDTEERAVTLTGEAYFEIAHNVRPFFVYADEAVVEILGTEFNVQAYNDQNEIRVVVADGNVAVHSSRIPTVEAAQLEKGDMASLHRDNNEVFTVTQNIDLSHHLAWLENKLVFDNNSMNAVSKRLERWYGIEIEFSDPGIEELKFSATFEDESIHEVLRVIDIALNLNHEIQDQTITFNRAE